MEDPAPYPTGPANSAEPLLATEDLVALAHARRQGIPYETGEQLLDRLPERLRVLADLVLSGQARTGDVAYALAVLIDAIEGCSDRSGSRRRTH